jgi:hypothetical protein
MKKKEKYMFVTVGLIGIYFMVELIICLINVL